MPSRTLTLGGRVKISSLGRKRESVTTLSSIYWWRSTLTTNFCRKRFWPLLVSGFLLLTYGYRKQFSSSSPCLQVQWQVALRLGYERCTGERYSQPPTTCIHCTHYRCDIQHICASYGQEVELSSSPFVFLILWPNAQHGVLSEIHCLFSEYWIIYRGPVYPAVEWYGSSPAPTNSSIRKSSFFLFLFTDRIGRGRGWEWNLIIRTRERDLVLYISFNTLWSRVCKPYTFFKVIVE